MVHDAGIATAELDKAFANHPKLKVKEGQEIVLMVNWWPISFRLVSKRPGSYSFSQVSDSRIPA